MKNILLQLGAGFLVLLCISFAFSSIRAIGHDECHWERQDPAKPELGLIKVCPNTPCGPMYIDKMEPIISTRWFCEIR